jgi:hypothetical protein
MQHGGIEPVASSPGARHDRIYSGTIAFIATPLHQPPNAVASRRSKAPVTAANASLPENNNPAFAPAPRARASGATSSVERLAVAGIDPGARHHRTYSGTIAFISTLSSTSSRLPPRREQARGAACRGVRNLVVRIRDASLRTSGV